MFKVFIIQICFKYLYTTKDNKGYIIEFKYQNKQQNYKKEAKTVFLELVQDALHQIDDKRYDQDLIKRGIEQNSIVKYAMVFYE